MSGAAPDARIVLRSRGLLESCDLALYFLARHARIYARAALAVALPGLAASLALRYALGLDWAATWLLSLALAAVLEGPFTVLTGQLAIRADVTAAAALGGFLRRLPVFGALLGLAAALQALCLLAFVVPWFFVAPVLVFLPEVLLLEGAGAGAFRRAGRVVAGHSGRALGLVCVLLAGRAAAVVLADAALRSTLGLLLDVRFPVEALWADGGSPYALVGLWLSVPATAACRYMAYVDLRTRKEGWDLQRRFHVLAARLAAEGG